MSSNPVKVINASTLAVEFAQRAYLDTTFMQVDPDTGKTPMREALETLADRHPEMSESAWTREFRANFEKAHRDLIWPPGRYEDDNARVQRIDRERAAWLRSRTQSFARYAAAEA